MTDISDWPDLVRLAGRYVVVPLNPYQMGNLIDALGQVDENGDWYGEFCNIVGAAMDRIGFTELYSNRGNKFTRDDLRSHNIRR